MLKKSGMLNHTRLFIYHIKGFGIYNDRFYCKGVRRKVSTIRLAGIIRESFTDGIGIRYVAFTQGCEHNCPNCHNPETWDFDGGTDYNIDDIISDILENPLLDGVTISGGDPLYRTGEVLEFIKAIKDNTSLNIWLYTGFTYEECLLDKDKHEVLRHIDVLVDGEYRHELRNLSLRFRGSSNQRVIDVQKSLSSGNIELFIAD